MAGKAHNILNYVLLSLEPHLILTTTLETKITVILFFADKETDAQKGSVVAAQGHTGPYRATQDQRGPHWATWDHMRPHGATQGHTGPREATWDHTGPAEPGSVPGLFLFNADISQPISQLPLTRVPWNTHSLPELILEGSIVYVCLNRHPDIGCFHKC